VTESSQAPQTVPSSAVSLSITGASSIVVVLPSSSSVGVTISSHSAEGLSVAPSSVTGFTSGGSPAGSSTQTSVILSTVTVVPQATVPASIAISSASDVLSGLSSPDTTNVVLPSASVAYSQGYNASTSTIVGPSVYSTFTSNSVLYLSGSTASQSLSGISLSTSAPQPSSTSAALNIPQASSTTTSSEPAIFTGMASSIKWSLASVFGSIFAMIMIIFI
jgi:hypothetical protein